MKYEPYKNEFWNQKEAKNLFETLPFYNVLIEKPEIKKISNVELLHELPFYDELSVVECQMHLRDMQVVIKLKYFIIKIL